VILSRTDCNSVCNGGDSLGELDLEGLGVFSITTLCGNGDSYYKLLVGNSESELIVCNNSCTGGICGCPSEGYIVVSGSCYGKVDNLVRGSRSVEVKTSKLKSNLFGIGSFGNGNVTERISGNGGEVEVAAVNGDYTGNVGNVAIVCSVDSLDVSNSLAGGSVVRAGDSEVNLVLAKLEVVVSIVAYLKDSYTLYGNKESLLCNESCIIKLFSTCKNFGVVDRLNGLDSLVNYLYGSINDLVCAVVKILITTNNNGHTGKDNAVRIVCEVVNVVTAFVIQILNVETVSLGTSSLGEHTGDDTCYSYESLVFCRSILSEGCELELGNREVELKSCSGAVGSGNGCGEDVCEILESILVNVYGNGVVLCIHIDSNLIGVNSPGNSVCYACDHNLGSNSEVLTGYGVLKKIVVESLNVFLSRLNIVCGSGSGSFFGTACGCVFRAAYGGFFTACNSGFFATCNSSFFATCNSGFFLACGSFFDDSTGITSCKNREAKEHC